MPPANHDSTGASVSADLLLPPTDASPEASLGVLQTALLIADSEAQSALEQLSVANIPAARAGLERLRRQIDTANQQVAESIAKRRREFEEWRRTAGGWAK